MSDYFAAKILIGGKLSASLREQLIEVAVQQGVQVGDYGGELDAAAVAAAVDAAIQQGQAVTFFDQEACYGGFDELERFCEENDLAYQRHNESRYGFEAQWTWWEPEWDAVRGCPASNDGDVLINLSELRRLIEADAGKETLLEYLGKHTPGPITPLTAAGALAAAVQTV